MSVLYLCIVIFIFLGTSFGGGERGCTQYQLSTFEKSILQYHNIVRYKHENTPPLCWSPELASLAKSWAVKIKENGGVLKHSDNGYISEDESTYAKIIRYGENIYIHKIIFEGSISDTDVARSSITDWNNQETSYKYTVPRYSEDTKYFTQLVWAATEIVGCGYAVEDNEYFVVVCNYNPEGNTGPPSNYRSNVGRIKSCKAPQIEYSTLLPQTTYSLKQQIQIACLSGFTLEGSATGICGSDGFDFGDSIPRCTGCFVPGIFNGTSDPGPGDVAKDQSWVSYTCNPGFNLDTAPRKIKCVGNELTEPAPRCRENGHCLRPVIPKNKGFVYVPGVEDTNMVYRDNIPGGAYIRLNCSRGYELKGSRTAVCDSEKFSVLGTCHEHDPEKIKSSALINTSHKLTVVIVFLLITFLGILR